MRIEVYVLQAAGAAPACKVFAVASPMDGCSGGKSSLVVCISVFENIYMGIVKARTVFLMRLLPRRSRLAFLRVH